MQVMKPGHRRAIARFIAPNCMREDVNEGEENAQFKAFHCSLIRCRPGVGMCVDPLMCASTMFPDKDHKCKYRPTWRAREAEILALAMMGYEKKMRARRFETLHDTTLWKVHYASSKPEENTSEMHQHSSGKYGQTQNAPD